MTTTPSAVTHDLDWIKTAMQSAVELEYATLPLYLSSMFSLEVQNYTVYNTLRSVAMEEMGHLAIACNVLAALGGSPALRGLQIGYPCTGLPGGAEPDLKVGLTQYSRPQLENFMRIEMPQLLLGEIVDEDYPTISALYLAIRGAVVANADDVRAAVRAGGPANQVGDDIGFSTIVASATQDPVELICAALNEILEQGEGATTGELTTSSAYESEESHYAKFAQLYYGARYLEPHPPVELSTRTVPLFFQGAKIGWPDVVNTLAVPTDGYKAILDLDPASEAVTNDLVDFDTTFSAVLAALDLCWNGPPADSWRTLGGAVGSMMGLRVASCFKIVRHEVPSDLVAKLGELYPDEIDWLSRFSDLTAPVFYGPRFHNINA